MANVKCNIRKKSNETNEKLLVAKQNNSIATTETKKQ